MNKISFIGCGSWGGALGLALANKDESVTFWHRNPEIVQSLQNTRKHYLVPALVFPDSVSFASSIEEAITGASKKVHSGSRMVGKTIKKYPKSSSAVAGASLMAFLDD